MASLLDPLKSFFPSNEYDEANSLLDLIDADYYPSDDMTIWQMNNLSGQSLADFIKNEADPSDARNFFFYLHDRLTSTADTVVNDVKPETPSAPTPNEEARLQNIWEIFINKFNSPSRGFVRQIVRSYVGNTHKATLDDFSDVTGTILEEYFNEMCYLEYAKYFKFRTSQFIRANSRRYKFTGQLTNSQSEPLTNIKVLAEDNNSGQDLKLGSTITNHEGYFEFKFTTLGEITTAPYDIDVEFPDLGQATDTIEFYFNKPGEVYPIQVSGYPEQPASEKVNDIFNAWSVSMPNEITNYLNDADATLRTIRQLGGLKNTGETFTDQALVKKLDAIAFMELLTSDYSLNTAIYEHVNPYRGVSEIANVSRPKFVNDVSGVSGMDNYKAGEIYHKARNLSKTALSTLARSKSGSALGDLKSDTVEGNASCGCKDCQSAVSPLAYLADLISYIKGNFEEGDPATAIDISSLETKFHQKFGSLPAECATLNDTVCQSRLAVEVLRERYTYESGQYIPAGADNDQFLLEQKKYRIDTYFALLNELGTSYEELRNVIGADEKEQQELADRLGIVLEDSSLGSDNTIIYLYQPVSDGEIPDTFDPESGFEEWLEEVFGFKSTSTDALTAVATSKVIEWKSEFLHQLWQSRDQLDTPFHNKRKAIIDPDIIGPDDFRNPDQSDNTAFKIWVARRTFVDDVLNNQFLIQDDYEDMISLLITESFLYDYVVGSGSINLITPWASSVSSVSVAVDTLQSYVNDIAAGNSETAADDLYSDFRLLASEAKAILDLYQSEQEESLTGEERYDGAGILIKAIKRYFIDHPTGWIDEETGTVELSPQTFWKSLREPKQGNWPFIDDDTSPLIDPQLINKSDLVEINSHEVFNLSTSPITVYENRVGDLNTAKTEIKDDLAVSFAQMIDDVYSGTTYSWDPETGDSFQDLYLQLSSNVQSEVDSATATINDTLHLSVEDFNFLMGTGTSYENGYIDESAPEFERLFAILLRAHKVISLYGEVNVGGWLDDESSFTYWKVRKAKLPKWRASKGERAEWQKALEEHSKAPLIDPHVMGPAHLQDPVPDQQSPNLPATIRDDRYESTETYISTLSGEPLNNVTDFESLINEYLFESVGNRNLSELLLDEEAGRNISGKIEQLNITSIEYRQLIRLKRLVDLGSISTSEKNTIYKILAVAEKRRNFYDYRSSEVSAQIYLSPEFFKVPATDFTQNPPIPAYPIEEWLGSQTGQNRWVRQLESRIKQQKNLSSTNDKSLNEIDETMMPRLRDAYVKVLGDQDVDNLNERARLLGDKLLISFQNNCCSHTNRISQAIETLQQFAWKTRTGDIASEYSTLNCTDPDFDISWDWMGSYANWRSAMFVFLYPENVLQPRLRRNQTPIFQDIVNRTKRGNGLNPKLACKLAKDYEKHLEDISNLNLLCSINVKVIVGDNGSCNSPDNVVKPVTMVFAKAGNESSEANHYYSMVGLGQNEEVNLESLKVDSPWKMIPGMPNNAKVKGCTFYRNEENTRHHVYIIYLLDDAEMRNKYFARKFDVDNNLWVSEPETFEIKTDYLQLFLDIGSNFVHVEPNSESFSTDILNLEVCENSIDNVPPLVALSLRIRDFNHFWDDRVYTFYQSIKSPLNELDLENYWRQFHTYIGVLHTDSPSSGDPYLSGLHAEVKGFHLYSSNDSSSPNDWKYYIHLGDSLNVYWNNFSEPVDYIGPRVAVMGSSPYYDDFFDVYGDSQFQDLKGLFLLPGLSEPFLLKEDSLFYDFVLDSEFRGSFDDSILVTSITLSYEESLVNDSWLFVGQTSNGEIRIFQLDWNQSSEELVLGDLGFNLKPEFNQIPVISNEFTDQEIEYRFIESENAYLNNSGGNPYLIEYIQEAYYFVPLQIALSLVNTGFYQDALDWLTTLFNYHDTNSPKKYYGLIHEEDGTISFHRTSNWFKDPLNPHAIAENRPWTYTRYTVMVIVQCLVEYANAEFTMDTSESVPRARELYEDAIDLLNLMLADNACDHGDEMSSLENMAAQRPMWHSQFSEQINEVRNLDGVAADDLETLLNDIATELSSTNSDEIVYQNVQSHIDGVSVAPSKTLQGLTDDLAGIHEQQLQAAAGFYNIETAFQSAVNSAGAAYQATMTTLTHQSAGSITETDWLQDGTTPITLPTDYELHRIDPPAQEQLQTWAFKNPAEAFSIQMEYPNLWMSGTAFTFCVVPNPILKSFALQCHANLFKIHNCMNIAGMVRKLDPFAASTDSISGIPFIGLDGQMNIQSTYDIQPSDYRYRVIYERAKQLVSIAQQLETSFLATLEKFDAESYSLLRAEQDLETSKANIKLQDLKIREAESQIDLAELQKGRAELQVQELQAMIEAGLNGYELSLINMYETLAQIQQQTNVFQTTANINSLAATTAKGIGTTVASGLGAIALGLVGGSNELSIELEKAININSLKASFARTKQQWQYQSTLASHDIRIGSQQVQIAKDRLRIVGQEKEIAELRNNHAKTTIDFLKNKFTSAELYEWMSGVLEDIYSYFLQEATAMAKMAERQLAFERQIAVPQYIRDDYWNIERVGAISSEAGESEEIDRRGLTGSARLLQDLTLVDQLGFEQNTRKLKLTKTISLSEMSPSGMQQFRETGIFRFATVMETFDRDHPGHYLRLIKDINVTVIALVPPVEGIKATLIQDGTSYVVTGENIFQRKEIRRTQEKMVLSADRNDSGVYTLQPDQEFLKPFEGSGVESGWEFRMEKAANPINYYSIADILLEINYEALDSNIYRSMVINNLGNSITDKLVLSFKDNLPDQWFDLHTAADNESDMEVSFKINSNDFAPNISGMIISKVSLYFSLEEEMTEVTNGYLELTQPDADEPAYTWGGTDGFIVSEDNSSLEDGPSILMTPANASAFEGSPEGKWTLRFNNSGGIPILMNTDKVNDIILIIDFDGETVPYQQ